DLGDGAPAAPDPSLRSGRRLGGAHRLQVLHLVPSHGGAALTPLSPPPVVPGDAATGGACAHAPRRRAPSRLPAPIARPAPADETAPVPLPHPSPLCNSRQSACRPPASGWSRQAIRRRGSPPAGGKRRSASPSPC